MIDASRYQGKPLRRLVELYALWAIGELAEADRVSMESLAPKLSGMFGGDGTWHAAIAAAVQFPPDVRSQLACGSEMLKLHDKMATSSSLKSSPSGSSMRM